MSLVQFITNKEGYAPFLEVVFGINTLTSEYDNFRSAIFKKLCQKFQRYYVRAATKDSRGKTVSDRAINMWGKSVLDTTNDCRHRMDKLGHDFQNYLRFPAAVAIFFLWFGVPKGCGPYSIVLLLPMLIYLFMIGTTFSASKTEMEEKYKEFMIYRKLDALYSEDVAVDDIATTMRKLNDLKVGRNPDIPD